MDINWLDDFVALANERNFSRAARRRNVTQPAFSRRIHALEEWLGTPLFVRTTRGAALSAAGEAFLTYASTATLELHRARASALEAAGRIETTLTIAATHALSFTFLPTWIRGHAPLEVLNVLSDSMQACEQMMLRGEATFLLCHSHPELETPLRSRQFISAKVGEDALIPVCVPISSGDPKWTLNPSSTGQPVPLLAYSNPSGLGRILSAEWTRKRYSFSLETVTTSRLAAALLTMARDGQGIAWVPQTLAQDDLDAGRLVHAGRDQFSVDLEVTLYRPTARLNRAAEKFWATL